ncbi:tRNA(Ile2) 2-agmatinylcytidine synthetase [Thermoplasma sp. Kam2015]|uniref:tRNA(Ile)(2)-agmatinylcytidine synthase n=1 Tax=Thermoplasma sp. Kam2015 TaxID=2094122 RepID=UPI000D9AE34E|nr:tRNA(Ile)(2)-agmatinylcytidine synthase [Thermoplasma sp. Kam2015]PYB68806.1 tRNA(Ile2) 2-agmatinylcytidine synthetase [Thermoplasma sp. Kam2015]
MFLAIDDTDSPESMCTTYLALKLIEESKLDIIGDPWLVRLNPNIRFKTRGNGAIVLRLGYGKGRTRIIGDVQGKPVLSYEDEYRPADASDLMEIAEDLVSEYAVTDYYTTHPGIVVSERQLDENFYWKALEEEISVATAEKFISGSNAIFHKIKEGHGIVGSAAAMAWPARRYTYEVLEYAYPRPPDMPKETKLRLAAMADSFEGTFNNIDVRNAYPAIFPHPKTPVIYGIRGFKDDLLLAASDAINEAGSISYEGRLVFKTNQATDDHIIHEPENIEDLHSYSLKGYVESDPIAVPGGHYFLKFRYRDRSLTAAAFEPTKEFRSTFSKLRTGDSVSFYGSYVNGNLNVEKMIIHSIAKTYRMENPICHKCGTRTISKGQHDFRCPKCGARYRSREFVEIKRDVSPGRYDVPVIARRHLSMPFEIEGLFAVQSMLQ